jgi:hypothetical protein
VLPDLLKVQSNHSFHIESGVSGDKVHSLGDTINDYHDRIIAMSWRKLNNEVDANDISSVCWSLCRVKFSIRSIVLLLHLIA